MAPFDRRSTSERDVEIGGRTYRAKETRRNASAQSAWAALGRQKPAREITYKPRDKYAPKVSPTTTTSQTRMNAPVVARRLTAAEQRDQRKKNIAVAAAGGAGAGKAALTAHRLTFGSGPDLGYAAQIRRNLQQGAADPDRIDAIQADKWARTRLGRMLPYTKHIRDVDWTDPESVMRAREARRRLGMVAPLSTSEAMRAYRKGAKRNIVYSGTGALLAGGAAALKSHVRRDDPRPYETEFSTKGMKRIM